MNSNQKRRRVIALDSRVLVVAVEGGCKDFAAYIGAVPGRNFDEESSLVEGEGTKLSMALARFLFPDFSDLSYRS
jgi:hypothetical protein